MELLQDVFLIRFVTKHYYLMRKLIHVVLHCCKVTQRQDVVLALSSLFGKFLSHIRPLAVFSVAENESQDITRHGNSREQLQSILDMLYLQVFSSESLIWNGNWKVQAFVFSLLYAFYSPDCSIPEEYRIPLAKYLCSQVMIVRAIVQRMIHLILQICSNAEKAEWKGILSHLFSDESFEQSLLRTLYQDLSIYDAAEQTNGPSPSDATTMTLAFSFFADSVDAWTCWIVDGGEPWPRGYFERPNNDWVRRRICLSHTCFSFHVVRYP